MPVAGGGEEELELASKLVLLISVDANGEEAYSLNGELDKPSAVGELAWEEGPGELGMPPAAAAEADSLLRLMRLTAPFLSVEFGLMLLVGGRMVASSLALLLCGAIRAAMWALTLSAEGKTAPKMPPRGVPVPLGVGLSGVPLPCSVGLSCASRGEGRLPDSVSILSTGAVASSCSVNVINGAEGRVLRTGGAA